MEYYGRAPNYIYGSVYYLYSHKLWLSFLGKVLGAVCPGKVLGVFCPGKQTSGYTGMLKGLPDGLFSGYLVSKTGMLD
jgi:hypothetical protein